MGRGGGWGEVKRSVRPGPQDAARVAGAPQRPPPRSGGRPMPVPVWGARLPITSASAVGDAIGWQMGGGKSGHAARIELTTPRYGYGLVCWAGRRCGLRRPHILRALPLRMAARVGCLKAKAGLAAGRSPGQLSLSLAPEN